MLRSIKEIETYSVKATDGILGPPRDFYFDDQAWVIRYLVVETDWVARRRVLISPISIMTTNSTEKLLTLSLDRRQINESPHIDTDKPLTRQQEAGYLDYFSYGEYWGGGGLWGAGVYPDTLQAGRRVQTRSQELQGDLKDHHLRSANAVMRYYVHAADGDIGHVQGILINEMSWAVQYLIVNTSNWWLGHQVLIAPQWIDHMSWAESTVYLELTRDSIKHSPPYDPANRLGREQEVGIHAHYGRKPYWLVEKGATGRSREHP